MRTRLRGSTLARHGLLFVALAAVLLLLTSFVFDPFTNYNVTEVAIYAISAAGLTVLTGINGQISLGHGALMMIGAYTTSVLLTWHPDLPLILMLLVVSVAVHAQNPQAVLDRGGSTVSLEPYAPNIIRVTLSLNKDQALAAPGYGFTATPAAEGWASEQTSAGDVYRSARLVVSVAANHPGKPVATQVDIGKFFNGSTPWVGISIATPEGKTLLRMTGWSMSVPNHKDGNAGVLNDKRPSDAAFYQVGASFFSPDDEHYYGLGQNQEGFLDHRGHRVECWHNYDATAALARLGARIEIAPAVVLAGDE